MTPNPSIKRSFPLDLLSIIPVLLRDAYGKNKAIEREDLLLKCQNAMPDNEITDSQMRLAIQSLRDSGLLICNLEMGQGYFIAATIEEYEEFKSKYTAHAYTVLGIVSNMDKKARELFDYEPGQMRMGL